MQNSYFFLESSSLVPQQQAAPAGPQLVRNQRRNRVRAAEPQVQAAPQRQIESDDESGAIEIDEKMGAKKRAKLEAKAEKRAQREAELKSREEQKKRDGEWLILLLFYLNLTYLNHFNGK